MKNNVDQIKNQEKILSGIIKFYNSPSEYKKISSFLNLKNFDEKYHKILQDLIKHDFIDIEKYPDINYDENITIDKVLYYQSKIKEEEEAFTLSKLKDKLKDVDNITDMSSLILSDTNVGDSLSDGDGIGSLRISNVLEDNIDFLYSFKGKTTLGAPSGIPSLDAITEGSFGLVGLTATPGAGKTTLALQTTYYNAFILKKPVLYITLEINKQMFVAKFVSFITGIPLKRLLKEYLSNEETEQVNEAIQSILDNENLYIMDNKDGVNFLNILKNIKDIKKDYYKRVGEEIDLLVILDYLNLFHDSGSSEKLDNNQKVAHQMVKFIEMKNETKSNFILIAAKNKRGYDSAELSSIKGPNDLEYAFETILSLERPKNIDNNLRKYVNVFATVLKSRWGEAFVSVPLHFSGKRSRFYDINDIPPEVKTEYEEKFA